MSGPHARLLADGRLHLQHGPIDLVIEAVSSGAPPSLVMLRSAEGASRSTPDAGACFETPVSRAPQHDEGVGSQVAYRAAITRFATILPELCAELPDLRRPVIGPCRLEGVVARRMHAAVAPLADERFITPMAAVAGAVAEEVLAAMLAAAPLRRASVNNGGDIALYLSPGETVRIGLVDRPDRPSLFGAAEIGAGDGIGGVATSGWRGRSFSLGIADAVTVLAATAAAADAAATAIANAVDLPGHPAVTRRPAREVQADSDLGDIPVTRDVGPLAPGEIAAALAAGVAEADRLLARGLIRGAALHLQGTTAATVLHGASFSPCGRRWQGEALTDEGATPAAVFQPSSDLAQRGRLLPQGEKDDRSGWRCAA